MVKGTGPEALNGADDAVTRRFQQAVVQIWMGCVSEAEASATVLSVTNTVGRNFRASVCHLEIPSSSVLTTSYLHYRLPV